MKIKSMRINDTKFVSFTLFGREFTLIIKRA